MKTIVPDASDMAERNFSTRARARHEESYVWLRPMCQAENNRTDNMNTTILALDLGTQTGWALASRDGSITSGSQSFKPQRFEGGGMRYLRFKRWLYRTQLSGKFQSQTVQTERPSLTILNHYTRTHCCALPRGCAGPRFYDCYQGEIDKLRCARCKKIPEKEWTTHWDI